jgi:hypothetical protein
MADTKATDEAAPLVYYQAFLAGDVPLAPFPVEDRAPTSTRVAAPTTPPAVLPSSLSIVYDTGATAHMWGSRSGMESYNAYPHSRWIGGISKYAHGSGTAVLRLDPGAQCPHGLVITLKEVLYVPGLRDLGGMPVRLFSRSMAQHLQPKLKVSLTHGSNHMVLPDGGHIPLREGDGLLYLDCAPVHDRRSAFADFSTSTHIAKGVVSLGSSPSVPSIATDKGEFG